jgi:hypothetical protein
MSFKLNIESNKTKIIAQLSNLRIKLNLFKKKKYEKQNSYLIMSPTSIGLTGTIEIFATNESIENPVKQFFILDIQDINLNMCPPMLNTTLKMINSIRKSIDKHFKSNDLANLIDKEEYATCVRIESFFNPISFEKSDFWFTPLSSLTRSSSIFSMSESNYSIAASTTSGGGTDAQNKSQLAIRTSKMEIKLETGVQDQVPLICFSLSLNGEFSNWTMKPSISLTLNLEMSYFNEALNVWEPVIEPVEETNSEKLRPYQLSIDVIYYFCLKPDNFYFIKI